MSNSKSLKMPSKALKQKINKDNLPAKKSRTSIKKTVPAKKTTKIKSTKTASSKSGEDSRPFRTVIIPKEEGRLSHKQIKTTIRQIIEDRKSGKLTSTEKGYFHIIPNRY